MDNLIGSNMCVSTTGSGEENDAGPGAIEFMGRGATVCAGTIMQEKYVGARQDGGEIAMCVGIHGAIIGVTTE